MTKLKESNITQILPQVLAGDARNIALGYSVNRMIRRIMDYCKKAQVYASLDTADGDILDYLAAELGTQYYDTGLPLESKRKLVKNTLVWYMRSGTPAAVEELVAAVFGEGDVEEWFEYGDEPFFFRITTNTALTENALQELNRMISKVKNIRSHLRSVSVQRKAELELRAGLGITSIVVPPAVIMKEE